MYKGTNHYLRPTSDSLVMYDTKMELSFKLVQQLPFDRNNWIPIIQYIDWEYYDILNRKEYIFNVYDKTLYIDFTGAYPITLCRHLRHIILQLLKLYRRGDLMLPIIQSRLSYKESGEGTTLIYIEYP